MMDRPTVSLRPAWQALVTHQARIEQTHLRDLCAADPQPRHGVSSHALITRCQDVCALQAMRQERL